MDECIIKQMNGRADKTSFKPEDADPKELEMGIKVEMEHTDDPEIAKKIALDHLAEFTNYYTLLAEMEAKAIPYKKENVITKEKLRKVLLQSKKESYFSVPDYKNKKITVQLINKDDYKVFVDGKYVSDAKSLHDAVEEAKEIIDEIEKGNKTETLTTSNSGSLSVKQISKNKNRNKIRKVIKDMGFVFGKK